MHYIACINNNDMNNQTDKIALKSFRSDIINYITTHPFYTEPNRDRELFVHPDQDMIDIEVWDEDWSLGINMEITQENDEALQIYDPGPGPDETDQPQQ